MSEQQLKKDIRRIEVDRMSRPLSPAESDRYRLLLRMLKFLQGR